MEKRCGEVFLRCCLHAPGVKHGSEERGPACFSAARWLPLVVMRWHPASGSARGSPSHCSGRVTGARYFCVGACLVSCVQG